MDSFSLFSINCSNQSSFSCISCHSSIIRVTNSRRNRHISRPIRIRSLGRPLIAVNVIVFAITILYFKNKLPQVISKFFEKLFRFEISKKITVIIIAIVLSAYVVTTLPELQTQEEWKDFIPMEKRLLESIRDDRLTIQDAINGNPNYPVFEPHTKYSLLIISEKVFGNFKVIPFLASIALLLVTYFITTSITNKRFAGIIPEIVFQYVLPQESSGTSHTKLKKVTVIVSMILTILILVLASIILPIIFSEFDEAIVIVQIMSLALVSNAISTMLMSNLLAHEKIQKVVIGQSISLTVIVSRIFLLGEIYGILGAAISFTIGNTVGCIYLFSITKLQIINKNK